MACGRTDERVFALVQELVDEIVIFSDADMLAAASWLWFEFGIAADLGGAAGVAALRSGKLMSPKGSTDVHADLRRGARWDRLGEPREP